MVQLFFRATALGLTLRFALISSPESRPNLG